MKKGLLILAGFFASLVFGMRGHDIGAGDKIAGAFVFHARELLSLLESHPQPPPILTENQLVDFGKALDSTNVISLDQLKDAQGVEVDALTVEADNGEKTIELNRKSWAAMAVDADTYRLIFHEYLRAMGLDDDNYKISSRLDFNSHSTTPLVFAKNMDFEEGPRPDLFPKGWYGGGEGYLIQTDNQVVVSGNYSAHIWAGEGAKDYGVLTQCISAAPLQGRMAALTGYLASADVVAQGAGLWMRVDSASGQVLGLDNMQNRPVLGSRQWGKYSVELYIPDSAAQICFGAYLASYQGSLWVDDLELK